MTRPRSSTVLLLAFPIVLLCSPPVSAHRVLKGGCLNYGHSCLGAHGKRASVPSHPPADPRPLLDILLDTLNTPTRSSSQYPHAHAANAVMGPRARYPEGHVQSPPASEQLSDMGLELRGDGFVGAMNDDLENVGGSVDGVLGSLKGVLGGRMDTARDVPQDLYYGTFDDDYPDARYKRNAVSLTSSRRGRLGASPNSDQQDRTHALPEGFTGDHTHLAPSSFTKWLRR